LSTRSRFGVALVAVAATLSGAATASARPAPQNATPAADARAAAVARALGHLRANPALAHADADHAFGVRDVVLDAGGGEHVRLDRTYRGLPVLGGDLVVHGRRDGAFTGVTNALGAAFRLSTTPRVARPAHATRLVVDAYGARPELAWEVVTSGTTRSGDPTEPHVLVSAVTNKVLDAWDGIETVDGSGQSLYLGAVTVQTNATATGYEMRDLTRGGGYTTDLKGATSGIGTIFTGADNAWGTGTHSLSGADRESAAVDAHVGVATTWDYYKNEHARLGIANDGKGTYSRVHYGTNYDNAFWNDSCFCMTFGDGDGRTDWPLVSLDIAGHEMSHGVTSRTAALKYSSESGGLNEATSDIFGTMVEFYAANGADPGDYDIGEEINRPYTGHGFRFMYHPHLDGASPDCWSKSIGRLNVHYSSGVANRFFFLLAEGTNSPLGDGLKGCNGAADVTGLGRSAAGRIWYRALTVYMTSRTDYVGARAATIRAAADLGYSTATVKGAWNSVGVPVSSAG
jgi:Zn-dependent metalloprotease